MSDRDLEHHQVMTARFVVGDGEGQVTAVLAGCGIAQLPSWLIKLQLEEGTLVEVALYVAKASGKHMSLIANLTDLL